MGSFMWLRAELSVSSLHNAHSPYGTHHCVSIRHLTGNVADCSFIYSALISFLHPKVPLRSTIVATWKELFQQTPAQAAGILPLMRQTNEVWWTHSRITFWRSVFGLFYPGIPSSQVYSLFFQFPNNNIVGEGIRRSRSHSRMKKTTPSRADLFLSTTSPSPPVGGRVNKHNIQERIPGNDHKYNKTPPRPLLHVSMLRRLFELTQSCQTQMITGFCKCFNVSTLKHTRFPQSRFFWVKVCLLERSEATEEMTGALLLWYWLYFTGN